MIKSVEVFADEMFQQLEVTNHFAPVDFGRFEDAFHLSGMTVGKLTLLRMFAEHVSVLDFEDFANAKGHGVFCAFFLFLALSRRNSKSGNVFTAVRGSPLRRGRDSVGFSQSQ